MDVLNLLQWPAMAVTLIASWLVASSNEPQRAWGFWLFFLSNALWIFWGWHTAAWALVALQIGLIAINVRGANKNET